ncbi:MAG: 2-amino-4-hydroxy-6-hydroxymethyldihydropteridine diphosphokinase [Phycisphaerales bacterium]|nr:2-amino-4-hydroxy-6-hydroxymethyldihydropteridine diphosphokinase [Phycisphaerales bacterium]
MTHTAAIGIGSNLGPRHATIHAGLRALGDARGVRVSRVSPVVETEPVGPPGQGLALNACALLETTLEPRTLLEVMLEIERSFGRDRSAGERWGPRTLDLDLLVYDDRVIEEPGLVVPHPELANRTFVLGPLAWIAPGLIVPGLGCVRKLAPDAGCRSEFRGNA